MNDKEDRTQSWSVVSRYLRMNTPYSKDIKRAKEIFLNDAPLGDFKRSYVGLILSPEISDTVLMEFDAFREDTHNKHNMYTDLQSLQDNSEYYFGNNSFLQRKEKKIFDHYQFVETAEFQKSYSDTIRLSGSYDGLKKKSIEQYLNNGWLRGYLEKHIVPDHVQTWREIFRWQARLQATPKDVRVEKLNDWSTETLLSIEMASQHPEKFDPNVSALANKMHAILNSNEVPTVIGDFYQNYISQNIANYKRDAFVANQLTVCVKFDNPSQLNESVEQLVPDTRYPAGAEGANGKIYELKSHMDGRSSITIINTLWKYGLKPDEVCIVDDKTLVFSLRTGMFPSATFYTISMIFYDLSDIKNKYISKNIAKGDDRLSETTMLKNSLVLEGLDGELFVSCNLLNTKLPAASISWLNKLAGNKSCTDLAIELASEPNYSKLATATSI